VKWGNGVALQGYEDFMDTSVQLANIVGNQHRVKNISPLWGHRCELSAFC